MVAKYIERVTPKFLVYTMYCGEFDFNHCVRAIASQRDVEVKHEVVSYLPEMEAHNVVYQAFNAAGPEWYRAKIDADVELLDDRVLQRAAQRFRELPLAHGISPLVHDYLSDSEIHAGVNFYTHHVGFDVQKDNLRCDRGMVFRESEHWLGGDMPVVGKHMHHCNELAAFRYGFHRGMKGQISIRDKVKVASEKHVADTRNHLRALALKGFDVGLSANRNIGHNYGDSDLMDAFKRATAQGSQ